MNRPGFRGFASILLLLCALSAGAHAAGFPGFTRTLWQSQDGLPEQTVQAFAQTRDGYLWIGTTGGLLRFDGAHFTPFELPKTRMFEDNGVFALLVSNDGTLWIGTEGGGLASYAHGVFQVFGPREGLMDGFVRAIFQDSRGTLWIGADSGLLRLQNDHLVRVDGTHGIPELAVHAIAEDHRGQIWVGGSHLVRFGTDGAREYHLPSGTLQTSVKSILESQDHTMWVGTVAGLHKLLPSSNSFVRVPEVRGTVRVLRQTANGTIWVGTIGQGIRCIEKGRFVPITAPESLPSNTVLNFFQDNEKNLWIGTQAGMLRLTSSPISIVPLPGARDSDFGTIYQDRDGTLWVISTDVFRIRGEKAEQFSFPQLGHIHPRNVYRDRDGALWVGTDGDGVFRLQNHRVLHLTTQQGLVNNFIRAILQSRDGSFWFLTDSGVTHWARGGLTNYNMASGLSFFSTRAIIEDRSGDIWIGTERGLNHWRAGRFLHDAATQALSQERVWSILQDSDGSLWFGTRNDGLYRWKDSVLSRFTTAQGLATNSIYEVLEDAGTNFWISGPNGISRVSRKELERTTEDPGYHPSLELFSVSDYVENAQIYGGRQPSGCLGPHGDVWFPSNKGAVHVTRDSSARIPPLSSLVIQQVTVDGRAASLSGPIALAPGNRRLEISYAPVLLRSQDSVRFRYRLDGFDSNWIDASNKRIAAYTSLPPGNYVFHVIAYEINNPKTIAQVSIAVVQRPAFYRTWWFALVSLTILAAIAAAIYRLRLWQVKTRFEAVLVERSRLAREMHDTVIQGCAGISAVLEALASLPSENRMAHDLMEHARTQVRSTIDEARQLIWNLRHEKEADNDLAPAIQRMASQISTESSVPIGCETLGRPFALNQNAMHELVMVVREALYNAVLHGKPSQIQTRICFTRKDLSIEIRDNGTGFDPGLVYSRESRHYGLLGMEERVQSIGGSLQLHSEIGKGTQLRVRVPRKAGATQSAMVNA